MSRIPMDNDQRGWIGRYLEQAWTDRGLPQSVFQSVTWAAENLCESPIERRMLAALLFCNFGYYDDLNQIVAANDVAAAKFTGDGAIIVPQFPVFNGQYRLDFLVVLNTRHVRITPAPCFAVECDGHDFHEKTKQQAARDKKRDRDLQASGIPVFRFTGSEIHKDVTECVTQLECYGSKIVEKLWGLK